MKKNKKKREEGKEEKKHHKSSFVWKLQYSRYDLKDTFQHLQNRIIAV